ncbi:MAG: GEVED domain-containing protein [Saprospiraceae bacterium]
MKNLFLFLLYFLFSFSISAQKAIETVPAKVAEIPTDFERCSTMKVYDEALKNNPKAETLEQFEAWLQDKIREAKLHPKASQRAVITIPYVIHVIHNGEALGTASNIPASWISAQMAAMNRDFRKMNSDIANLPGVFQPAAADLEIEFCPAVVDPNGNILTEPGVDRIDRNSKGWTAPPYTSTSYIDATIKPATIWNTNNYLNIWTCNLGSSLLGYATFPSTTLLSGLTSSIGTATTDGVVINYTTFGDLNPGLSANFNRGRTAVHEVGHWLGLRHVWGDATCGTDYCNDTPTQSTSNAGCPTFPKVTCSNGPNGDMFQNYMDYSFDACMFCFTNDQKTRTSTIMANSPRRLSLLSSTVCAAPGNNVGIVSITPPCTSGTSQTMYVTIKNKGTATINPGEVNLSVTFSGGVSGNYSGVLNTTSLVTNATEVIAITNVNVNSTSNITAIANATYSGDTYLPDNSFSQLFNLNTPAITSSLPTVCSGVAFTLTLTNPKIGANIQWQSSTNNITFNNISGATNSIASTSQTTVSYYRCKVTCGGTDYFSNVLQINMTAANNCYCSTTYSSGCSQGDQIANVVYSTLSNASTCTSGSYTFYNSVNIPNITRSAANNISITFGSDANQFCAVWIDHNNDGTFATTELMTNNTVKVGANGTHTASITIPAGTFSGQTRMRVRGGNDSALTSAQACGTSSSNYGETEDYLINIVQPCSNPTGTTISSITETSAYVAFSCSACTGTYIVEYGLTGFTPGTAASAGAGGTIKTTTVLNTTLTGLIPGTNYDVYVRQNCSGTSYSSNATKASFSTTCGLVTLPFSDGFNNATISTCWQNFVVTNGAVSPTITVVTSGGTPAAVVPEGLRMLRFNSATATAGTQSRLVSPSFNTSANAGIDISFRMAENDQLMSNIDKITVQYSLDNGATWIDVVDNVRPNANTGTFLWYTRTYSLPAAAANQPNLKVGFLFSSAMGNNIFFDDFKIYESPVLGNLNGNTCNTVIMNNVSGFNTFRIKQGLSTFAEINPNGVNLGTITMNIKENLAGSTNVPTLANGVHYLPRYFNINSSTANPFPNNVRLRLNFHNEELSDYNQAAVLSETMNSLGIWAYDDPNAGTTENCTPIDNIVPSTKISNIIASNKTGGFSLEFDIDHFTEFGAFSGFGTSGAIKAKVFLNHVNTSNLLMDDYVKTLSNFPLSDPYAVAPYNSKFTHVNNTKIAIASPLIASITGNDAVVDWLFLEMRTGTPGSTTVVGSQSALLQSDGDIVDMDGSSALTFPSTPLGEYYLAIRHRNHLGFRTLNKVSLNLNPVLMDFTQNTIPLFGTSPLVVLGPALSVMQSGDSNSDGSIDSIDSIFWESQNGLFDDYLLNSDYNLDGSVDSIDSVLWELFNGKYEEID